MLCIKSFPKLKSSDGCVLIEAQSANQNSESMNDNIIGFFKNIFLSFKQFENKFLVILITQII